MENSNSLTVVENKPQDLVRRSSDVAGLCKEIVVRTAMQIQGRKYVKVEGWQSIATAHGCIVGSKDVERVQGGFRAIGELRRGSDGVLLASAEGFVGEDEPTWFGGQTPNGKTLPKRPDYAIRAMCQTRAISRVCRAAFAHVVVLMDAGLSTTPAEEVPEGGFTDVEVVKTPMPSPVHTYKPIDTVEQAVKAIEAMSENEKVVPAVDWRDVIVPFGKNKGIPLGELNEKSLVWYCENFKVTTSFEKDGKVINKSANTVAKDQMFRDALDAAQQEFGQ